jgi:hypothetical protein
MAARQVSWIQLDTAAKLLLDSNYMRSSSSSSCSPAADTWTTTT